MASVQRKPVDRPDKTRRIDRGYRRRVRARRHMMRTRFEPGWRWSECVKPVVGGDSCQVDDFEYCSSGRMHGVMDDGDELDFGPGM